CLGCLNCVTACPSGVQYAPLIERTRAQIEREYTRDPADQAFRTLLLSVLPYPGRLRLALAPLALAGGLLRRLARSSAGRMLPERVRAAVRLAPPVTIASLFARVPEYTPAAGPARQTVAVLTGCVQRVSF